MKQEKIFIRPNGNQILVGASIRVDVWKQEAKWDVWVRTRAPRKRNWLGVLGEYEWKLRGMKSEEKEAFILSEYMKHTTESEIMEVKMLVWESLKPK